MIKMDNKLKNKLSSIFANLVNFLDIGKSKVFGRIQGLITLALTFFTWLAVYNLEVDTWWIIPFLLVFIIGFIIVGWIYVKFKLFKVETKRYAEFDYHHIELNNRLKRIEKHLGISE